jgi:nitrogen regulatory protein P-II 1
MKKIEAIIQPFMLSKVAEALRDIEGFSGPTVTKVQGFGRDRAKGVPNRIVDDLIDYAPKVKIETVVNDTMVDEVVTIILDTAHTGNRGDGKVFVLDVSGAIRIRTRERDETAV